MARSNKYTSLNFNGIFEKTLNNNNQPSKPKNTTSSTGAATSTTRIHGHMLVLSRPTPKPKPISIPQTQNSIPPQIKEEINVNRKVSVSDPDRPLISSELAVGDRGISLRPGGRTGLVSGSTVVPVSGPVSPVNSPATVKSDRFVPPHLRPGFVGKQEKPESESVKGGGVKSRQPEFRGNNRPQTVHAWRGGDLTRPYSSGSGRPNSSG